MNISKVCRKGYGGFITKLRQTHSAVGKQSSDAEIEVLQKQEPKLLKSLSGLSVVAAENYSPITHVSVLVKAGPRYEDGDNLGVSHCIRNCAALSSKNHTSFALTRHLERQGSKLTVSSTREYMIYSLQCIRDHIDSALPALAEIATQQTFKPWELEEAHPRMKTDLALFQENPDAILMEALHKAALRGGLEKSLYSPSFMIGKHDSEMLHDYAQKCYVAHRTVVSGLGVSYEHLETLAAEVFDMKALSDKADVQGKFGGGEVRIDANLPFTRAAIVAEGASLSNLNEMLSLGVLQCVLGLGSHARYACGMYSKLGAAAAKATDHPFAISSLNLSYSDAGLFGVYIAGHPNQMKEIVKSVVSQMRETTKKLSDEEIQNGKHALKAKLLLELDTSKGIVENMAIQTSVHGKLISTEELLKAIDALSAANINAVANKVMKTKPAMAAIGVLHDTPYLDELL